LKRTSLDLKKDFQWERSTINKFIEEEYEVTMSMMMTTEAILSSKLKEDVPKNSNSLTYDKNKLIGWIIMNIPTL